MRDRPASLVTCRLVLAYLSTDGTELETRPLGHVDHEAEPREWFDALPEGVDEGDSWLVVELWEESVVRRWLLDERTVEEPIADALVEGRLAGLLNDSTSTPA